MNSQNLNRHRQRRRGYLLLTVVVLIAVASLMLSRIANTSMRVASVAIKEEQEMRYRWAATSLRRYSLDAASTLFAAEPGRDEQVEVQEIAQPSVCATYSLPDKHGA